MNASHQMGDIFSDDIVGGGRGKLGHNPGHLLIEGVQKTALELVAVFILESDLNIITDIQPHPGNPPLSFLRLQVEDCLAVTVHAV